MRRWLGSGGSGAVADEQIGGTVEALLPLFYQELRGIARRERRRLPCGDTLLTTALIHEAYLRLANNPMFPTRGDFLRIAAVTIRRILVDQVRMQMAGKRGGGQRTLELDEADDFEVENPQAVLQVHDALETLSELNPRLAQVVECKFFAGFNEAETAEALGVSERTVQREWALARAWLKKEIAV
jgi:RNA polymerase sigma factor (TIGR02999 family)